MTVAFETVQRDAKANIHAVSAVKVVHPMRHFRRQGPGANPIGYFQNNSVGALFTGRCRNLLPDPARPDDQHGATFFDT